MKPFPSAKKGPRGGAIPSGRCTCDEPDLSSVKAVRAFAKALGTCSYCGDCGLDFLVRPMTIECLEPWPAAISGRPETRWRCNYCRVEGTLAELARVSCTAGAGHPPAQANQTKGKAP